VHVPRIVMIVANDITNDTRVLKEAVALGKAGYQVTLLGVSASGRLAIDTIQSGKSGRSEVVMIRGTVDDAEVSALEAYLVSKYGLL